MSSKITITTNAEAMEVNGAQIESLLAAKKDADDKMGRKIRKQLRNLGYYISGRNKERAVTVTEQAA